MLWILQQAEDVAPVEVHPRSLGYSDSASMPDSEDEVSSAAFMTPADNLPSHPSPTAEPPVWHQAESRPPSLPQTRPHHHQIQPQASSSLPTGLHPHPQPTPSSESAPPPATIPPHPSSSALGPSEPLHAARLAHAPAETLVETPAETLAQRRAGISSGSRGQGESGGGPSAEGRSAGGVSEGSLRGLGGASGGSEPPSGVSAPMAAALVKKGTKRKAEPPGQTVVAPPGQDPNKLPGAAELPRMAIDALLVCLSSFCRVLCSLLWAVTGHLSTRALFFGGGGWAGVCVGWGVGGLTSLFCSFLSHRAVYKT